MRPPIRLIVSPGGAAPRRAPGVTRERPQGGPGENPGCAGQGFEFTWGTSGRLEPQISTLTRPVVRRTFPGNRTLLREESMTRRAPVLFLLLLLPLLCGDLAALAAPVSVATPLGGDVFTVESLEGQEAISSLYAFTVDVSAALGRNVPFDALLGQDVTITVALPGAPTRYFHGIVSRFSAGDVDTRRHF